MIFKPLTSEQQSKKAQLVSAYCDFWNNIRFRKGWQKPIFLKEEVLPLLERAAEIVIRKRSEIDTKTKNAFTMRMIDGSAREYLWTVTEHPINPSDKTFKKESEFVHQLVHATFKDGNGYVENLTKEEIDEFIMEVESELDKSLPIVDRINRMISTLHTIMNQVNQSSETVSKELLSDNTSLQSLRKFERSLAETENTALSLFKRFNSIKQKLSTLENEVAESDEEEPTETLQEASNTLRQSANSLPVQSAQPESDSEEEQSDLHMEEQYNEEEEEKRQKEAKEQERRRKEAEELKRIEKEEAMKRQKLLEVAENTRKKQEAENNRISKWNKITFEPRFDVAERRDGFVISSFIPGMKKDDISIKQDKKKKTITISGVRAPAVNEEEKLKTELKNTLQYRYGARYMNRFSTEELDNFLLQLGSDRFGSFSETYKLPEYVDFDSISCSYEGGTLRVVVPVVQGAKQKVKQNPRQDRFSPFFGTNAGGFW